MEKKEQEEKEMVQRANEAVLERPRFEIDQVGDDTTDPDDGQGGRDEDEDVMDEVGRSACLPPKHRLLIVYDLLTIFPASVIIHDSGRRLPQGRRRR